MPRPTRLRALAAAVALVGTAACTSSGASTSASASRVLVIGDSLVHGTADTITAALRTAGWDPVVDGRPGWSIGQFVGALDPVVTIARPRVAVVVLGTNDCAPECRHVLESIDRVVSILLEHGVQRIFWLNVQEQPAYPESPDKVNVELTAASRRWAQLSIVDMSGALGGKPALHIEDGVHFNQRGALVMAALIRDAISDA